MKNKGKKSNKKWVNLKNKFKKTMMDINKRTAVTAFIIGLTFGMIVMALFTPDRIATLEDGKQVIVTIGQDNITADDLYKDMKENYDISMLLDRIDNIVLSKLYPESNEMKTEVNNMADYYTSMYETYYGYDEAKFLELNGFKTKNDFLNTLTLEYRRNKYYTDYLKKKITDSEIEKYYNETIFGDIKTKYITIDGTSEDDLALAKRVINRLNNNSYEDVLKHYEGRISHSETITINYKTENMQDEYISALKSLKDGKYTLEPVKIDSKYYIIFRESTKEKDTLENLKEEIKEALANTKKSENKNLYYEVLNKMREENNVSIKDTELAKKYENELKKETK